MRYSMTVALLLTFSAVIGFPSATLRAEEIRETYNNGRVKKVYTVTKGKKNGKYEEFYENGKSKTRARYRAGELFGPYLSYYEVGKLKIKTAYRAGKLHGRYLEKNESGKTVRTAEYSGGMLHGTSVVYTDGKPTSRRGWIRGELATLDGVVAHPFSREQVAQTLMRIYAAGSGLPSAGKEETAAVRRLNAYRFLCGAPFDVTLDGKQGKLAQAGTKLLAKIGRLDHEPGNPGMPEDEYKSAFEGTSNSNLHRGIPSMSRGVDGFMDDSDASNIAELGHRRWCLNPAMFTTGFGNTKGFIAMWSADTRRQRTPDWQIVAYPARGYMPVDYFGKKYAWCVILNPRHFGYATDVFKVEVHPLDSELAKGKPLKIEHKSRGKGGIGVGNAVIFRPKHVNVSAGSRYWVHISGLSTRKGAATSVSYMVDFARIKPSRGRDSKTPSGLAKGALIVPSNSRWKWLHPTDGVDPATTDEDFHSTFYRSDFDDSTWNNGRDKPGDHGGFGYGDDGFRGVDIGKPKEKEHRKTAYFRLKFKTDKAYRNLVLSCQRDDGIIVYLDGKEVVRDNVGSGKGAYNLFAEKAVSQKSETEVHSYPIKQSFKAGPHVLAISLHNRSGGSSDLRIAEISLRGRAKPKLRKR